MLRHCSQFVPNMSPTSADIKLYVSISIWSSFGLWDDRYVLLLPDSSCVAGLGRSSVLLCCRTGTVVCAIVLPDRDGSICYCVAGLGRSSMLWKEVVGGSSAFGASHGCIVVR